MVGLSLEEKGKDYLQFILRGKRMAVPNLIKNPSNSCRDTLFKTLKMNLEVVLEEKSPIIITVRRLHPLENKNVCT